MILLNMDIQIIVKSLVHCYFVKSYHNYSLLCYISVTYMYLNDLSYRFIKIFYYDLQNNISSLYKRRPDVRLMKH